MLVLSRKRQEGLVIGDSSSPSQVCRVTVLEIRGSAVRLGIEVGNDVVVLRSEIADQPTSSSRFVQRLESQHAH